MLQVRNLTFVSGSSAQLATYPQKTQAKAISFQSPITSHHDHTITSCCDHTITSCHDHTITSCHDHTITSHHDHTITSHHDHTIASHHDHTITSHHDHTITSHHDHTITSCHDQANLKNPCPQEAPSSNMTTLSHHVTVKQISKIIAHFTASPLIALYK